jgi:hypothetical protein
MGQLQGSEYDTTRHQDLGVDAVSNFGLACGIDQPNGPRTTWLTPNSFPNPTDIYSAKGGIIYGPDPSGRNPLGVIVARTNNYVWSIVRPHDCPHFMKYRPGLTPAQNIDVRERDRIVRWAVRTFIGAVLAVLAGLFVAAVLKLF